jgi:Kef-type K+ transport system membrane component KefB
LIAGFLAGTHFDFFPSVKDVKSVEVWAEIGLSYYFSLGLEFSFKKLMKVGGTASITAITQIITMVLMGFSGTMDGLETNGQHLWSNPLDFLHHNYSQDL